MEYTLTDKKHYLPYARQVVDDEDIEAVVSALRSNYLTTGPYITAFEKKFSEIVGGSETVVCSSGTAALHLACLALNLGPGDLVIVPAITFLATANVVRHVGADVLFSDVDPGSGLMEPKQFEETIGRATKPIKAVFPVHLGGQTANMSGIAEIADRNKIVVVEDASHAIGASYCLSGKGIPVGSCAYSGMSTFSFHAIKTIAMGEGGAVTTKTTEYADRLRLLRNHGILDQPGEFSNTETAFDNNGEVNPWYYEMHEPGFNYRASDIHCALGLSQLNKMDRFVVRRKKIVSLYDRLIEHLSPVVKPISRSSFCLPAWHLYQVLINFQSLGLTRKQVMIGLREEGVGSQVHYIPVYKQPYFERIYGKTYLEGAENFYENVISLPLFTDMNDDDVSHVINALNSVLVV